MKCVECEKNDASYGLFCDECRSNMWDTPTTSCTQDLAVIVIGVVFVVIFFALGLYIGSCI